MTTLSHCADSIVAHRGPLWISQVPSPFLPVAEKGKGNAPFLCDNLPVWASLKYLFEVHLAKQLYSIAHLIFCLVFVAPALSVQVETPEYAFAVMNSTCTLALPPDAAFNIITDPDNKRVFKNIKASSEDLVFTLFLENRFSMVNLQPQEHNNNCGQQARLQKHEGEFQREHSCNNLGYSMQTMWHGENAVLLQVDSRKLLVLQKLQLCSLLAFLFSGVSSTGF